MLINSHLVLASILEPHVKPANTEEYYLGSIAPDIRYYANIPRQQTHLPLEEIIEFADRFPYLPSFNLGYMIHCASENLPKETGLSEAILNKFPFSLKPIQQKLPRSFISVLLAFYHLENYHPRIRLSENGNEILRSLGIQDETVHTFTKRFNQFLDDASLSTGMSALSDLGLLGNTGVNTYLRVAKVIKNPFIKRWLFSFVDNPIEVFHQKSIPILLERCEPLTSLTLMPTNSL